MNNLIILKNLGVLPELFLGISIIYLLIFGSILSTHKKYPLIQNLVLNLSVLILVFCFLLVLNDKLFIQELTLFNNTIVHDYLSFYSKVLILIFSIICLIMIQNYIKYQKVNQFEYLIIVLLSVLGFLILCSANDLITAYLAIELQSLSFYVMASFKKNSSFSVEAGLKYFILGSFSSAILLFGSSLLYGVTGSLNFSDFKDLYYNIFPGYNNSISDEEFQDSIINSYCSNYFNGFSLNKELNFVGFKNIYSCYYPEYTSNEVLDELIEINSKFFKNLNAMKEHCCPILTPDDLALILTNLEALQDSSIFNYDSVFLPTDSRVPEILYDIFLLSSYLNHDFVKQNSSKTSNNVLDEKLICEKLENGLANLKKTSPYSENPEFDSVYSSVIKICNYSKHNFIKQDSLITSNILSDDRLIYNQFENKVVELKTSMISRYSGIPTDSFYSYYINICDHLLEAKLKDSVDSQGLDNYLNISENTDILLLGLMLVLVSLLFKLSVAPLHAWSPDVYEGSPTSSTLFFAVVSKLSLIVLLIRIFNYSFSGLIYHWRFYIVILAVLSIIIGSFGALEQKKLKSLLAYSSISHIGYILIAFCTGTIEGIQSIIAYISIYMLAGSCLWSIFIILKNKTEPIYSKKTNKDLSDLSSLIKSNKVIALIFSTVLFSIAGFPPLIGFYTKLNIFLSVMESSMFFVAVISILTSVISTFYYIRIIKVLCFENNTAGKLYHPLPYLPTFIIVVIFFLLIFLFINPNILYLFSYKISVLFYN